MLRTVAAALLGAVLVSAQQTQTPTVTATGDIPSVATTGAPCAQVSSLLESYARASPDATARLRLPAQIANDCAASAPIIEGDALGVVDAVLTLLEWQSTLAFLREPPSDYPLAGVDLIDELRSLRRQVQNGDFSGEIEFETALVSILARAHDGHLGVQLDGINVFDYRRTVGGLVSVSADGVELPQVYVLSDLVAAVNRGGNMPPSVISIDGEDVTDWLNRNAQNTTVGGFQDPDALYNAFLFSHNSGSPGFNSSGLFVFSPSIFPGEFTTLEFSNGTTEDYQNFAVLQQGLDFTGVEDGESFYYFFCNATYKALAFGDQLASPTEEVPTETELPTSTPSTVFVSQIPGYPTPVAISEDGSLSGYFLSGSGFADTAVLVLAAMSQLSQESFQDTLTDFLNQCRSEGKTHLIIDMSGNPGGSVALGYDTFKQLFPTLEPYAAGNFRAHPAYDLVGQIISEYSESVQDASDNETEFAFAGGYSMFAAESYNNASGQPFTNWADYYGPVDVHGDTYTNLLRWDINNPDFTEAVGQIVISGYANESDLAPQPFEPENIIMFTDGQCSSTCAILAHLLKWQAKVKSVAVGGRPVNGPMQGVGGVKGSQVFNWASLYSFAALAVEVATQRQLAEAEETSLLPLMQLGDYFFLRGATLSATDAQVNIKNNVAEGDTDYTPTQFLYEAADCRLWYQPDHILDIGALWRTVAEQAFGLGGIDQYSLCVRDSMDDPTSLSGNPDLFNEGRIQNVTEFIPEVNGPGDPDGDATPTTSSAEGQESTADNAAPSVQLNSLGLMMVASIVTLATIWA